MKFVHTSDLHLGKNLHFYSLIEDQRQVLAGILDVVKNEHADGLIIAGDIYDRSYSSEDAVRLFDWFLTAAVALCPVYVIAGNHDSADRLAFGREIMSKHGVHLAGAYSGQLERLTVTDENGPLNIWLLPYIKTSQVREFYHDSNITTADLALQRTIQGSHVDPAARNLLVAHQFIVGTGINLQTTDSENSHPIVGGADCMSADLLDPFDYVALGHLHRPQAAGRPTVRYCGSPMKYSESEAADVKGVTVVSLGSKGDVTLEHVPLTAPRDLRVITGTIEDLLAAAQTSGAPADDYVAAVLLAEASDARNRLLAVYPRLIDLRFSVADQVNFDEGHTTISAIRQQTPLELFDSFYQQMNGRELTAKQREIFLAAQARVEVAEQEAKS